MNSMAKNELRELRLKLYPDKSQAEFCRMVGINHGYVTRYENGVNPSPHSTNMDISQKYAKALEVDTATLLTMISNNYQLKQAGKLEVKITHGKYAQPKDNALAKWRAEQKLTMTEVAEVLGVSYRTYHSWERGESRPIGNNLKNLLDLTGLSMHQISSIFVEAHKNDPDFVPDNAPTTKKIEEPKQEPLTFSDMPVINAEWPLNFIKQVRRNNTKETYFPIKKEYPFVDQWIADKLFDFVDNPAEKDAQHHYRFNEQQATAVRLYYREFGNNLKSVGEKMGISKSRVQQIIMKAQRKFKICIENEIIRRANAKSGTEVVNDNLVKAASAIKENVTKASENFKETVKDVKVPAIKPEKEITMKLTTKEERTLNNTVYPVDPVTNFVYDTKDVKDTNNQIVEIKRVDNATGKMVKMIDRFNDSDMKLLNEVMELCYGKLDFHKYNRLRKILGGLVE